jgi:hypothetical protein
MELSEQYKSLLRLNSVQDILLKNKLLPVGKPKLAAFSMIFSRVAQGLMKFLWDGREIDSIKSPSELGMVGDQLTLQR